MHVQVCQLTVTKVQKKENHIFENHKDDQKEVVDPFIKKYHFRVVPYDLQGLWMAKERTEGDLGSVIG
jgi:hypothetical protein